MYEIIIKHHTTKKIMKREYGVIEKRPYTDKEIEETNSHWRQSDKLHEEIKEVMGHRPPVEVEEKESRDIYRQEVEDLDLAAVIIAVNKLQQAVESK